MAASKMVSVIQLLLNSSNLNQRWHVLNCLTHPGIKIRKSKLKNCYVIVKAEYCYVKYCIWAVCEKFTGSGKGVSGKERECLVYILGSVTRLVLQNPQKNTNGLKKKEREYKEFIRTSLHP